MNTSYDLSILRQLRSSQVFFVCLGLLASFPVLLYPNIASAADITLTWNANSGIVEGYRVFVRKHCENYNYDYPDWEGPETTCTIYSLDENYTHYFVVRAFNEFGESPNSNEVRSASSSSVIEEDCGTTYGGSGGGCLIAIAFPVP